MRASSSENANGFGEVIVGASVEAENPVFDRVLRRKDEHRRLNAALAQRRENIDTVAARQHEIEQQIDRKNAALARKKPSSPVAATETS